MTGFIWLESVRSVIALTRPSVDLECIPESMSLGILRRIPIGLRCGRATEQPIMPPKCFGSCQREIPPNCAAKNLLHLEKIHFFRKLRSVAICANIQKIQTKCEWILLPSTTCHSPAPPGIIHAHVVVRMMCYTPNPNPLASKSPPKSGLP